MQPSLIVDAPCLTGRARAATSAAPARITTVAYCTRRRTLASTGRTRRVPANKAYRTTPLRALWQHAPYFHDGSAATLADVVVHHNRVRGLGLTAEQQRDLIEYLKSL